MGTRQVSRCILVCDSCGAERGELATDATNARIAAAADGWKFIQYGRRSHGTNGARQAGPRQWDACPNCELPATAEKALLARTSHEA